MKYDILYKEKEEDNIMMNPDEILAKSIDAGVHKVHKTFIEKAILGFIGGAMISLGYLLYIRVISDIAEQWGSFASFIGACVFPIGLIVILLAGGELITGNMMAVATAFFDRKVSFLQLVRNWIIISIFNVIGAVFVAYFFGHMVGLLDGAHFRHETILLATNKIKQTFIQSLVSGVGCNWFVGLALWLSYGAKDAAGKIMGIWFPIMAFVAIGFQHSVANAFVIPAAIFEGGATWMQFIQNFIPVYLGNIIGGAIFTAGFYYLSYKRIMEENKDLEKI